jgi:MFS family permease
MTRTGARIIAGATLGLAFGYGPVFLGIASVFLKPIADSFGWSRADVSLLPSVASIGVALTSPVIGRIADQRGWNAVIAVSIALLMLGLWALAMSPASIAYIVVAGLFIGVAGTATTAVGYNSVIARSFDRQLGLALGIAMTGSGLGTVIVPMIAGGLLQQFDWRLSCFLMSLGAMILGFSGHRLIFYGRDRGRISPAPEDRPPSLLQHNLENLSVDFIGALTNYRFWIIGLTGTAISAVSMGTLVHLAAYFSDRGFEPLVAAQFVSLYGMGLSVGRVAVGYILDRIFAPLVACTVFLLGAAGLYILSIPAIDTLALLCAAAILVGIAGGAEGDLIPFFVRRYFGLNAFGAIYGALFMFFTIGSALGPLLYGLGFDGVGNYNVVLLVSAAVAMTCAGAVLMLGRYRFEAPH